MANTYKQAYFQLVFAVRNRKAVIQKSWKDELEKYITGIVQANGHKLISIGTASDHIHIFIGYNLNHLIPDLVEAIKTSSNQWVNDKNFTKFPFSWQNGYGAFTYAHSQIDNVAKYVLNQWNHHETKSFKEEYFELLRKFNIEYKEEYCFDFFEDDKHP